MQKTGCALILSLSLLSSVASAENASFYGGLGYGSADYEGETDFDMFILPGQRLKDNAEFVELYVGYHLNRNFSFEIGYADFDDVSEVYRLDPDIRVFVPVNNREDVEFSRMSLSVLVEYPFAEKLSVFGLLGYAYSDMDRKISGGVDPSAGGLLESGSDSESDAFWGLGIKYSFNPKYAARLQWTDFGADDLDLEAVRFSLEMNF